MREWYSLHVIHSFVWGKRACKYHCVSCYFNVDVLFGYASIRLTEHIFRDSPSGSRELREAHAPGRPWAAPDSARPFFYRRRTAARANLLRLRHLQTPDGGSRKSSSFRTHLRHVPKITVRMPRLTFSVRILSSSNERHYCALKTHYHNSHAHTHHRGPSTTYFLGGA